VTRLPDTRALVALLRAALRHEVMEVTLGAPAAAGPHRLAVEVGDARGPAITSVSLHAEAVGPPRAGRHPLRLRPLDQASAAELQAVIDAHAAAAPEAALASAAGVAGGKGSKAFDPKVTARMDGSPLRPAGGGAGGAGAVGGAGGVGPPASRQNPRATARSLEWSPPARSPARQVTRDWGDSRTLEDARARAAAVADEPIDPRRTMRSRGSLLAPREDPAAIAVSGVSEVAHAMEVYEELDLDGFAAEDPSHGDVRRGERAATADPSPSEPPPGYEDETPSMSVRVVFESEAPPTPTSKRDDFFDAALANLPMHLELEAELGAPSTAPDGGIPDVSRSPSGGRLAEDAEDEDTLVRAPGPRRPPADSTPTNDLFAPTSSKTGSGRDGGGRRRTTRRGTSTDPPGSSSPGEKKTTRRGASEARRSRPPEDLSYDQPLVGRRIADGKYSIESLIGSGAAGAVYQATHRELRRTVAVKVLHAHYQHDAYFMKSFRGEALAASQLDHPNVMRVLDFGQEPDGLVYIVMEFLSGRTLQSLLDEERRLHAERAVEIMVQVCAALSVAHDHGIIHRDIKPDNIMLVPSRNDEGRTFELVKVCDFGIAALQNPRVDGDETDAPSDDFIAGTPEYRPPEQARGNVIDARADVYACGICLYELLTGRPPFIGEHPGEILVKQLEETPRRPSQVLPGLDSLLEEIILRALQKDPGKRQQSARELRVELKEFIDPSDAGSDSMDDERSIVENVPVLDDPASGFPGFFIALTSSVLRVGRFERGHPEAPQAMKELASATRKALRGRREITFARRDGSKAIGYCVVTGHSEIAELKRLLGSQLYGSFAHPFVVLLVNKGIAAITLREGIPDAELKELIELLLGPLENEELRNEVLAKALRHVSTVFVSDVVGRDRRLAWKVGLAASRLARDLRALSTLRGISLKKMREIREDLVLAIAHLLVKGDEVRQFLFNADLVDDAVANLRGFSGFQVAPLIMDRIFHEPCAETVKLLLADYDAGTIDHTILDGYLKAFATRLLGERSPNSDAVVAELNRRKIVTDEDLPRDLAELIRATALADALVREPTQFLRALDGVHEPEDYAREAATLEAAMGVLARRAEASALLATIAVLARHAKGGVMGSPPSGSRGAGRGPSGERETIALRTMKTMIDKDRLLPVAHALLDGPLAQREPARHLLVLAGTAGAQAILRARESVATPDGRAMFVKTFRDSGPAAWALLAHVLPRVEVQREVDIAFVEDLLHAMPDRLDAALGEAAARFLAHPRLRAAALRAIGPLWGERARKPLLDALEFAEEPARMVAITELRRMRGGIDEMVVNVIERFMTMKGSASEELRAAAALALTDVVPPSRARALALLVKAVEGKRGLVAMIRGDDGTDESVIVTEAMARALVAMDRAEGIRAIKARVSRSDGVMRARLTAVLQSL